MGTSVLSSFTLTGPSFDPEDITRRIGLEPTKTWKTGNRVQGTQIRRKHSGWVWSMPRGESLDLGKQVAALLERLGPFISRINEVREELGLDAEICAIYIEGQTPAVHFDRSVMSVVNQLEAEIDLDIYLRAGPEDGYPPRISSTLRRAARSSSWSRPSLRTTRPRSIVATTGLSTDGRSNPASFHLVTAASPSAACDRDWLVTARMMRSARSRW